MIDLNGPYWRELAGRAVTAFEAYVSVLERELAVNESREKRMQRSEERQWRRAKADLGDK